MIATSLALLAMAAQYSASVRQANLRKRWGTYDEAPISMQTIDGPRYPRVNVGALIYELQDLHVNTYIYLIWHLPTDWDDLRRFLLAAKSAGIDVWVDIPPPSEQPPILHSYGYAEPYRTDYDTWGKEIARLSNQYSNLKAWVIDDFTTVDNWSLFTPSYMQQVIADAQAINPQLAFLPTAYDKEDLTGARWTWLQKFNGLFDGMLLAHNYQSNKTTEAEHKALIASSIATVQGVFGSTFPIVSEQFTSRFNRTLAPSSTSYFLLTTGYSEAGSVIGYINPHTIFDSNYNAIKEAFESISGIKP